MLGNFKLPMTNKENERNEKNDFIICEKNE